MAKKFKTQIKEYNKKFDKDLRTALATFAWWAFVTVKNETPEDTSFAHNGWFITTRKAEPGPRENPLNHGGTRQEAVFAARNNENFFNTDALRTLNDLQFFGSNRNLYIKNEVEYIWDLENRADGSGGMVRENLPALGRLLQIYLNELKK